MTSPPPRHLLQPWRLALRAVARAVPPAGRPAWLAEWLAELWFAAQAAAHTHASPVAQHTCVARFCHGALADAHCLRHLHRTPPAALDETAAPSTITPAAPPVTAASARPTIPASPLLTHRPPLAPSGSALRCLATLAVLSLAVFILALTLPTVSTTVTAAPRRPAGRIVLLSPAGMADSPTPTLRLATVRSWQHRPQHLFTGFAFFAPVHKAVHIDARHAPELTIARGSANLVPLLDQPLTLDQPPDRPSPQPDPGQGTTPEPTVYLSETTWRTLFHARPDLLGTTLRVGLDHARIAGVLPDRAAPPGQTIDLWLLLPDPLADHLPASTRVFALGQLAPAAATDIDPAVLPTILQDRWHFSIPHAPADDPGFDCVSLAATGPHPLRLFLFALVLALITLPALTPLAPLTQGDIPPITYLHPLSALRRHLFLAAKLTLILPVAYLAPLDLAAVLPCAGESSQLLLTFLILLTAVHWALRDQRHRCPTCLRALTCPARVGQPSRNFLSWNGTELICTGGHGLLHVPELPTSWFSRPRWLHLDPSWQSLFLPA